MTINPQTLKALEFNISSFVQSYERAFSSNVEVDFMNCNLETARRVFSVWQREIAHQKEELSAIRELWPDGRMFVSKLDEFIITQVEFINNLARWREFLKTKLNTGNSKSMEKNREFLLKNRELPLRLDSLLYAANELLKNAIGLDMNNYLLYSYDATKLDTSPEGLLKIMHYIDKVTVVLAEYNKLLLKFLEHHNLSILARQYTTDSRQHCARDSRPRCTIFSTDANWKSTRFWVNLKSFH